MVMDRLTMKVMLMDTLLCSCAEFMIFMLLAVMYSGEE